MWCPLVHLAVQMLAPFLGLAVVVVVSHNTALVPACFFFLRMPSRRTEGNFGSAYMKVCTRSVLVLDVHSIRQGDG